ncbi:MAG TPA: tetratricopeptide repeat protein [Terracidiphilus sp.]|jgi:Flp pilus assembly protein TadD|nr:tetratricopeptide repeat protein [Terracidiphilus sp.]
MMSAPIIKLMAVIAVAVIALPPAASAGDVKIKIPARSSLSPVQHLNREGVEAVNKRQYDKAEKLFYKAYLYDPTDPFTLNNLGFIAEQQGQLDRAHTFYALASEQSCSARIDLSNAKSLEKKPMRAALDGLDDLPMRVNRLNVDAIRLVSLGRPREAATLLQKALALDPHNPFTLNNLGVASEADGDVQAALKDYETAAASGSSDPVLVTLDHSWSGKPVKDMAKAGAKRLQIKMRGANSNEMQAALLNMRGVTAANENDPSAAKADFMNAYTLDPSNAFSLNNRGYVAEQEGDLESAQFFYEKARRAGDGNNKVGFATDRSAEGHALSSVATDSDRKMDGALAAYSRQRHSQTGPVELTPRSDGMQAAPTQQSPQ